MGPGPKWTNGSQAQMGQWARLGPGRPNGSRAPKWISGSQAQLGQCALCTSTYTCNYKGFQPSSIYRRHLLQILAKRYQRLWGRETLIVIVLLPAWLPPPQVIHIQMPIKHTCDICIPHGIPHGISRRFSSTHCCDFWENLFSQHITFFWWVSQCAATKNDGRGRAIISSFW